MRMIGFLSTRMTVMIPPVGRSKAHCDPNERGQRHGLELVVHLRAPFLSLTKPSQFQQESCTDPCDSVDGCQSSSVIACLLYVAVDVVGAKVLASRGALEHRPQHHRRERRR